MELFIAILVVPAVIELLAELRKLQRQDQRT
jgi:hypothetical protein